MEINQDTSQVKIRIVEDRKDLKEFIFLPEEIHAHHANWVPPVYTDEWDFYSPEHNKSFGSSDSVLMLAYSGKKPVGRIMGIINDKYNNVHHEHTARFFNFDCFNDQETAHYLLSAVEKWASDKGMTSIIGSFGFSDKDPQGLQVEGFEFLPVIATPLNLPYLPRLLEKENYQKQFDCLTYKLNIPQRIPPRYERAYHRLIQGGSVRLLEFKSKCELKPWIVPVLRLVNETYNNMFGFIPMDEEEMFQLADKYLPLLDPEFTKLVLDAQDTPVAFIVATPDISAGLQKANGRLFPFGFRQIHSSAKKTKQLDLLLGAVRNDYRNKGITALLGVSLFQSALARGLEYIDSHLILETNHSMRNIFERQGGKVYKRYRIYKKNLLCKGQSRNQFLEQ